MALTKIPYTMTDPTLTDAINAVTVFLRNETGSTIDLASSTLSVRVVNPTYA